MRRLAAAALPMLAAIASGRGACAAAAGAVPVAAGSSVSEAAVLRWAHIRIWG